MCTHKSIDTHLSLNVNITYRKYRLSVIDVCIWEFPFLVKGVLSDIILGVFSSLTHVVAWKDLVDMALGSVIMNRRTED